MAVVGVDELRLQAEDGGDADEVAQPDAGSAFGPRMFLEEWVERRSWNLWFRGLFVGLGNQLTRWVQRLVLFVRAA